MSGRLAGGWHATMVAANSYCRWRPRGYEGTDRGRGKGRGREGKGREEEVGQSEMAIGWWRCRSPATVQGAGGSARAAGRRSGREKWEEDEDGRGREKLVGLVAGR